MNSIEKSLDRARGSLVGLACGDAVGAAVEFKPRGTFEPVIDMRGGGKFRLEPGQWTDDTSMALCMADSLLDKKGFDARDQMERYKRWIETGYRSCKSHPIGIGKTILQSMMRYQRTGEPFSGSSDERTAGNGALMRLAPIPIFYHRDAASTKFYAIESTRTTHAADLCIASSTVFAEMIRLALTGASDKSELFLTDVTHLPSSVAEIAYGDFLSKSENDIRGTGFVVDSLEAALWCFHTTNSFEEAILRAANLGDDADTTAAICGQLAGAYYGYSNIPKHWLDKLYYHTDILNVSDDLFSVNQQ